MTFKLPALNYSKDALAPYLSQETIEYHYGKHHQTYVDKLNALVEGTSYADQTLEEIIKNSEGGIFNNAAQIWNHSFYWNCLSPQFDQKPEGELYAAIEQTFGSYDDFVEQFTAKALAQFGSGWAWLVKDAQNNLSIMTTSNAQTPLTEKGVVPLLTCDVWEHAYYIDYRNARPKYMEAFWKIVNWQFVNQNWKKNS